MLTALLTRLPDATNRTLIDQAAVDFAFLNSKAGRKRLIKVSSSHIPIPEASDLRRKYSSSRKSQKIGTTSCPTIQGSSPR